MPEALQPVDFRLVKRVANGMLDAEVYQAIYDLAASVKTGDILEVGTAHGAATITMALGLQNSGHKAKVITIDKIEGGSRDQFGTIDDNIKIIKNNFKTFGVEQTIDFQLGASENVAPLLPDNLEIGMMMLDADGAIDRDFSLFYNTLQPGAPIVIDDYKTDYVRVSRHGRKINIEQKRRITSSLVGYFESKGMLQRDRVIHETYFGHKPKSITRNVEFNLSEIMKFYRELVFAEADLHSPAAELIGKATKQFPGLHKSLKNIYMPSGK